MSRLPHGASDRQVAIQSLHDHGARFVLCNPEGATDEDGKDASKHPISSMLNWQKLPPVSAEDAVRHEGRIGIEPASLGFAVVDVDGESADLCGVMRVSICEWMAVDPLLFGPSLSGAGRGHLWFGIDLDDEAPLGRRANGKPYVSAPTGMRWIADEAGSEYDVRFRNGYVIVDPYLPILTAAILTGKRQIGPKWASLIPHGTRYKRRKRKAERADNPPVVEIGRAHV